MEDLVSITDIDTEHLGSLALCEISFDWYAQQLETLPAPDLIRSTLKNALEHFDRRRIIFFSSSSTLLLIQEEELKKQNNTIEGLAARIEQLFRYYMPLSPTIIYQDHVTDLLQARKVYHRFQELLELSFYGELGTMNAHNVSVTTSIPELTYRELATRILALPTAERLSRSEEHIKELLNTCRQQHVVPDKVIQYSVRLLVELEYQLSEIPASAHDQIVECRFYAKCHQPGRTGTASVPCSQVMFSRNPALRQLQINTAWRWNSPLPILKKIICARSVLHLWQNMWV
ncbi:MAG: hypothetical protein ACLTI1_00320 [Clostridia bacterium]